MEEEIVGYYDPKEMTPEEMIEDLNVRTAIAKEVRVSYNSNEDILFVYLKKEINENNIRIMASDESQDFYTVFGDNDKAIGHILYDFKNKYLNNDSFDKFPWVDTIIPSYIKFIVNDL